jgi:hypothetical protein
MRTALCLSGQARFGSYAFRALAENLLKGLDCDIFMFLWRLPGQSENDARAVVESFVRRHAPIRECVFAEQIDFPAKDYASRSYPGSNIFNIQSMLYAIKMVDQLRVQHEQRGGFKYDCVIRARGDLSCFSPFDLKRYQTLLPHYLFFPEVQYFQPGFNDTFAFSCSKTMEIYSGLYDRLDEYFHKDNIQLNPHAMLLHHVIKNRLPFAYLSMPVDFVRELPMPNVFEG